MNKVLLKTSNLCKSYGKGELTTHVLINIDIEIFEGDFTVIMGSSGSGKSTLLYSISSMDKPTCGTIHFMDKEISSMNEKQLSSIRNKDIGFIFQSINLLPDLSVFENITYPAYLTSDKTTVNAKANKLLEKFGLDKHKEKHPHELSGGEQQRVAIARALVSSPKIIYGDEPTGALNASTGKQVLDMLTILNETENQSIVMVTHSIHDSVRANRILFLTDGKINGELMLGKYEENKQKEREEIVFEFLKEHNW